MDEGPSRYSSKTKIGNWNEELHLKEERIRKYLEKKAKGELMINKIHRNMQGSLKPSGLTYSKDGNVRYGDYVMLYSVKTEGVLSVDLTDRDAGNIEAYAVTTSTLTKGPVARNVFVITPARGDRKTKIGDVLRFNQSFCLKANPLLTKLNLSLTSMPLSPMQFSKISKKQLVLMSIDKSADTLFKARYRDSATRFEFDGEPVPCNAEIVIQHNRTGKCLFSDKINYHNDFGTEFEVACETQTTTKRKQVLVHEKTGKLTGDNAAKSETSGNYFAFLTASDPSMESAIVRNDDHPLIEALEILKSKLIKRSGLRGLTSIARVFRIMNDNFDGFLSSQEFSKGLKDMGVDLNQNEQKILFNAFDKDGNGKLSYNEFVQALIGKANERRLVLIDKAFSLMDKTGDGKITVDDLKGVYVPESDPETLDGKKNKFQVLSEFLGHFEASGKKDGVVTLEEWRDYYNGISASIDSDEYFELMMKRAW
eukprot:CAMPEP_0184480304 /NCGR_PEP_ID=MMETSP0113_2-20130426/1795_1 /TAXON_ID=91329 /ORGANISM="Norrisiella sphaerica, Strain BC52" /LENGTH=480 /DNA_ID=CAMNT_0026858691 /DNA_START=32 /DNA_END=1471 /DNA_ORIENTATION=-